MPEASRILGFQSGVVPTPEDVERAYSEKIRRIDSLENLTNVDKECLKLCVGKARRYYLEKTVKDNRLSTKVTRYFNGLFSRVPISRSVVYTSSTTSAADKSNRITTSVICKQKNGIDEMQYYVNGKSVSRPEYDDAVKKQRSLPSILF